MQCGISREMTNFESAVPMNDAHPFHLWNISTFVYQKHKTEDEKQVNSLVGSSK